MAEPVLNSRKDTAHPSGKLPSDVGGGSPLFHELMSTAERGGGQPPPLRKLKPYKLPHMFERLQIEKVEQSRHRVRNAKEQIQRSREIIEEAKLAVAVSRKRKNRQI